MMVSPKNDKDQLPDLQQPIEPNIIKEENADEKGKPNLSKRAQKQADKNAQDSKIDPSEQIGDAHEYREKRRGRKRERDDLYFIKAQQRIEDLKAQLRTAK